jgi:hypothetical protein
LTRLPMENDDRALHGLPAPDLQKNSRRKCLAESPYGWNRINDNVLPEHPSARSKIKASSIDRLPSGDLPGGSLFFSSQRT